MKHFNFKLEHLSCRGFEFGLSCVAIMLCYVLMGALAGGAVYYHLGMSLFLEAFVTVGMFYTTRRMLFTWGAEFMNRDMERGDPELWRGCWAIYRRLWFEDHKWASLSELIPAFGRTLWTKIRTEIRQDLQISDPRTVFRWVSVFFVCFLAGMVYAVNHLPVY